MFEVDSSTDEQHEDLEENMSFVDFVTLFILLDGSTFSDHLPGRYPWGPIPEDPGMVRVHTVGGGNVGQTCRGVARVIFCVQPFSLFTAEEDNILPSVLSETLNNSSSSEKSSLTPFSPLLILFQHFDIFSGEFAHMKASLTCTVA